MRRDQFTAMLQRRDCGYKLREMRPADTGWYRAGPPACWRDREQWRVA